MSVFLLIGISTATELNRKMGHVACTLGGVNYESRGGKGCLKGSAARGANHPMFKRHFHLVLTDEQARKAKRYADAHVGEDYVLGGVPPTGGDCSGYVSGIICAATGREPIRRLFATGNWKEKHQALGFREGLGNGGAPAASREGQLDRPYPGRAVKKSSKNSHVKWIQARLNLAARDRHPVLGGKPLVVDGDYGDNTDKVVRAFQQTHGLQQVGQVGPRTWRLLNDVR